MAITFAVAYLLCVLTPPVALASIGSSAALHCLMGSHHHKAAMVQVDANAQDHDTAAHSHGAAAHHHAAPAHHHEGGPHSGLSEGDGEVADATCCGLFCVSAMSASTIPGVVAMPGMLTAIITADQGIVGRGPDRIDRPPNFLLPS